MTTKKIIIQKNKLKGYKPKSKKTSSVEEKEDIDELVGPDMTPIEGGQNLRYDSEIEVGSNHDSTIIGNKGVIPNRWYGLNGTNYSHGHKGTVVPEGEDVSEKIEIDEAADEMRKMVEDVLKRRRENSGLVKKTITNEVNNNKTWDDIVNERPQIGNYVGEFMKKIELVGINNIDDIEIIFNYIKEEFYNAQ